MRDGVGFAILNKVVKVALIQDLEGDWRANQADTWRKSIPGRRKSQCKNSKISTSFASS